MEGPALTRTGILLLICSLAFLSTLDASGKLLTQAGVPVLVVSWVRYVVHTGLLAAVLLPRRGKALLRTQSLKRQMVRAVLMILSTVLFFSVLHRVPLAQATAMNFLAPFIVMALAPWLLRESHRLHRWLGVAAGFAGMLVIVRPGGQLDGVGVALGLLTALVFALFQISTRRVAADDPLTTNFYSGLLGSAVLTLGLPFYWDMPQLAPWQWALLLSTGVTGLVGHTLQTAAYARVPASLLAPFFYVQIVYATTLGWLIFRQLPDALTWLGIAMIVCAGVAVALREARLARAARQP